MTANGVWMYLRLTILGTSCGVEHDFTANIFRCFMELPANSGRFLKEHNGDSGLSVGKRPRPQAFENPM